MDYFRLVDKLAKEKYLKTPLIIQAFKKINRADFVPENMKEMAGFDAPLPIGFGQTISQPRTVAFMLELLQPALGDKILDIGAGSGWTGALLAQCVGAGGKIFAMEKIEELCRFGKKNILKYNFIGQGIVKMICADGSRGWSTEAPFDKILVSAAAREIPGMLKNQLAINGRLVIPVRNSVWLVIRKSEKEFEEKEFYGFSFVPLVESF